MKKICFIADSIFKSAGMQRVTAVIAEELTKYYDVTIVTFEDPQQKDLKMYDLEKYPIKIVFTHFPEIGRWKRISYNIYSYLYKNILPYCFYFGLICAQFLPQTKARGCGKSTERRPI